jgi:competence protein ComEA
VPDSEHPQPLDHLEPPGERGGHAIVNLWHRVRAGEDPVAFGAVVVVLALIAGVVWFWAGARHGGVQVASAAPSPPGAGADAVTTTTVAPVAVHVAGAVARPGLYRLPAGSRVADALGRAGGRLPAADVDRLNLAAKLVDGQKILVPKRGEVTPLDTGATGVAIGNGSTEPSGTPAEPIDLNTADLAALDALPGIGPATARAIVEERERRGGFRSPRDLLRVPGIGEGRFARLKDRVRV